MKTVVFVATAVLLSTAACAQMPPQPGWYGGPPPAGPSGWDSNAFWRGAPNKPHDRIQFLRDRLRRGVADGSLDPNEAARVNGELDGARQWIAQKHWEDEGHLTPRQTWELQKRLDQISQQIHWLIYHRW